MENVLLFLVVVFMLVLLLGCSDFFLFRVNVVLDVIFLLLRLGGFVLSLEFEFVCCEMLLVGVWLLLVLFDFFMVLDRDLLVIMILDGDVLSFKFFNFLIILVFMD